MDANVNRFAMASLVKSYHLKLFMMIFFPDDESKKILRLSKAAAVASAISLVICATHIYDASSEFGIYSVVEYVDAWHWWALQTIKRLEEVFACMLVLVIAFRKPCDRKSHVTTCFGERKTHAETIANVTKETHPAVTSGVIQIT